MSEDIVDACIYRLHELRESQGQDLAIVLHGGEPLLLGHRLLRRLLIGLRRTLGPASTIALQTNGTLLSGDCPGPGRGDEDEIVDQHRWPAGCE